MFFNAKKYSAFFKSGLISVFLHLLSLKIKNPYAKL